jgi:hypothetical protein
VEEKLKEIKQAPKKFDNEIKRIQTKYHALHFANSVGYPGVSLVVALFLSEFTRLKGLSLFYSLGFWYIAFFLILFVSYKIVRCLLLVQEISLAVERPGLRMKKAFQEALASHEREIQEEIAIAFVALRKLTSADIKTFDIALVWKLREQTQ